MTSSSGARHWAAVPPPTTGVELTLRATTSAFARRPYSSHDRELDLEGRPRPFVRGTVLGNDPALVLEHDVLADREPQTMPLGLGREERFEQVLQLVLGDAGAVVGHPDRDLVAAEQMGPPGCQLDFPPGGSHGL